MASLSARDIQEYVRKLHWIFYVSHVDDMILVSSRISLDPGSLSYVEREPVTHGLRMRQIFRENVRKIVWLLIASTRLMHVYYTYQVKIRILHKNTW